MDFQDAEILIIEILTKKMDQKTQNGDALVNTKKKKDFEKGRVFYLRGLRSD